MAASPEPYVRVGDTVKYRHRPDGGPREGFVTTGTVTAVDRYVVTIDGSVTRFDDHIAKVPAATEGNAQS